MRQARFDWLTWMGACLNISLSCYISTHALLFLYRDGKDDYVFVGDNGSLSVWYNRGNTDDNMAIDGLRFADIAGGQV